MFQITLNLNFISLLKYNVYEVKTIGLLLIEIKILEHALDQGSQALFELSTVCLAS